MNSLATEIYLDIFLGRKMICQKLRIKEESRNYLKNRRRYFVKYPPGEEDEQSTKGHHPHFDNSAKKVQVNQQIFLEKKPA